MDAFQLRERAWEHVSLGNLETASILMRRARELELTPPQPCTEVIL